MINKYIFLLLIVAFISCDEPIKKLPILGNREVVNGDTIYHKVPDFKFMDQDSQFVTNATFENGIYIVDFFFTSCPTICPITGKQMSRVQEKFKDNPKVKLMAHSVDYKYDSVPVLKKYSEKIGAIKDKWYFVKGPKMEIFKIANDYFSVAKEDPTQPGGYDHSGRLILVDQNRHVRAFCDGTNPKEVDAFMLDVERLLNEKENEK